MFKSLAQLRSAVAGLFRRRVVESEMEEELRTHVRHRADDLERSGLARGEAERQARVEFGGYERFKEECRESLGAHFLETLIQDLGFGLRLLRKAPGFAAVAVLTLALGIGANTAIFSLVYGVLLRPLPYPHPEQLVVAFEDNLQRGVKISGCSYPDLKELQQSGMFSWVAGVNRHDLTLTGSGDPTVVTTVVVTPEIFPLLNVKPVAGRYLIAEDEIKGSAPVVVLSEGLWRTRYGESLDMIGRTITMDQRPFTVVGIMPAGFRVPVFGEHQEVWIPLVQDPLFSAWIPKRDQHWLPVVGRLNAGVSLTRARAEADAVARRMSQEFPAENGGWAVRVQPLQDVVVGNVKAPLLVLLCAVGLVLLLACVNIANLLLARATSRTREMALRQALGAKRSRIIRQLLTESAVLGTLGAILGVALAYVSSAALASLLPRNGLAVANARLDGWVLGFALLLSLAATMAFSLAPAFLATHANVQSNLKDSAAQSGSSGVRLRVRRFLAAAEIGLATVLVVAAGLLVRSLMTMTAVDPGFNVAHVLKADVSLPRYRYAKPQQWSAFCNALLERIQAQPGLKDSAIGVPVPLADSSASFDFSMPDRAPLPPGTPSAADYVSVSPEYFHVMEIPLLQGRVFAPEDSDASAPVTIVNEAFARFYFRNEDPIGQRLTFGFPPDTNVVHRIVGVVGDIRDRGLAQEPGPIMYVPFAQAPFWGGELLIKSNLPPAAVVSTIRAVVDSLDKDLPVTGIMTMPEAIDASVAQPKFRAWLLGAFGVVAVLLAAVGVFGVVSYSVASRTQEFGVRAALGASPASIGRMILREGLILGGIGLSVGLAAALGFARFLKSQLYGVTAHDPATFLISAAILLVVAAAACVIPARRAMSVDPIVALRYE
jgi:putative ABC transport system permease protein